MPSSCCESTQTPKKELLRVDTNSQCASLTQQFSTLSYSLLERLPLSTPSPHSTKLRARTQARSSDPWPIRSDRSNRRDPRGGGTGGLSGPTRVPWRSPAEPRGSAPDGWFGPVGRRAALFWARWSPEKMGTWHLVRKTQVGVAWKEDRNKVAVGVFVGLVFVFPLLNYSDPPKCMFV